MPCATCTHPQRAVIDQQLRAGVSFKRTASQFVLSASSVRSHVSHLHHLTEAQFLAQVGALPAAEAAPAAEASGAPAPGELSHAGQFTPPAPPGLDARTLQTTHDRVEHALAWVTARLTALAQPLREATHDRAAFTSLGLAAASIASAERTHQTLQARQETLQARQATLRTGLRQLEACTEGLATLDRTSRERHWAQVAARLDATDTLGRLCCRLLSGDQTVSHSIAHARQAGDWSARCLDLQALHPFPPPSLAGPDWWPTLMTTLAVCEEEALVSR
jgi:hypothetical protein